MRSPALAVLLLLLAASPARAAWSPVAAVPASSAADGTSLVITARGDAAVAWSTHPDPSTTAVRVALRRGAGGRFTTTTLRRRRDLAISGLGVVVDARGETTAAWVEQTSTRGLLHGPITVRAASRPARGRWSPVATIAAISPFRYAVPRLAVDPGDRRVLLTFNAGIRRAPGAAAVWRRPGHAFGRLQDLRTGPRGRGYLHDPTAQFDAAGRAYVAGITGCDTGASEGALLTAAPGATRFTTPRTVAPAPASALRLALTGTGRGVLSWLGNSCSTSEGGGGPLSAATVGPGAAGAPVRLEPMGGFAQGVVPGPGGTAEVWSVGWSATPPDAVVLSARSDGGGLFGAAAAPAGDLVPVIADGRGDQLVGVADANWLSVGGRPADLQARAADGALTPPPVATGRSAAAAAVTPAGAGLAVVVPRGRGLGFTSWRP